MSTATRKKGLFGLTVPEIEFITAGKQGSKQAWWLEQKLRAHRLNLKLQKERAN